MTTEKLQKPPLGIIPKWLWLQKRKEDLMEAISRYYYFDPKHKMLKIWTQELSELTIEINDAVDKAIDNFKNTNERVD